MVFSVSALNRTAVLGISVVHNVFLLGNKGRGRNEECSMFNREEEGPQNRYLGNHIVVAHFYRHLF